MQLVSDMDTALTLNGCIKICKSCSLSFFLPYVLHINIMLPLPYEASLSVEDGKGILTVGTGALEVLRMYAFVGDFSKN